MNKALSHLHTINKHKVKVTWLCFRCHLYKQGLLHDLSKYSYIELKTGFHYYQGFRSPIDAEKEEKEYLSAVIKPFRHRIAYIVKMLDPFKDREKIVIYYRNCYNVIKCFELPEFKSELMYKNMRIAQSYKIEDLGL